MCIGYLVNGLHFYDTFVVFLPLKQLCNIHPLSHTSGAAIRSNLRYIILPKDSSTCTLEEPRIEPADFPALSPEPQLPQHYTII